MPRIWWFVFGVALLDAGYALVHAETLPEWEANPVALALFAPGGPWAVVALKAGTTLFAALVVVGGRRRRSVQWVTRVMVATHVLLLIQYLRLFLEG